MITLQNGQEIDVLQFDHIDQVKGLDMALGHYFFSEDTMRFFHSKVYDDLWVVPGAGVVFITSEKCDLVPADPRRYTVRVMRDDGRIDKVSEFQEWATLRQARAQAQRYQEFYRSRP